ncbi:MAG TPA: universal stress protein [Stenomitos sp.]
MRRILLATEGSACSNEAIQQFTELFEDHPAELFVLSVIAMPTYSFALPHEIEACNREADQALEALDQAIADLARAGHAAHAMVRVGDPAQTIVQVARELGAQLIVVGTHGRQGLERIVDGSVAEAVLRHAPCAVLVQPTVRAPVASRS